MAVNTWDGSSSTDWGTAANWTTTGVTDRVPTADDDVIIPDCSSINNCILDGDTTINSLELGGSSNFSMNNHDLTIDNENGSGRALDVANNTVTFVGGTGTLIFTKGSSSTDLVGVEHLAASTELRNLQFNGAATFNLEGATTVTGNLTISAGTVTTTGSNHALTVTGELTASGGSLLLNNSTVSFGAVMAIGNAGTVTCADTNLTTHSFSLGQGPFTAPSASGSFIITNETSNLAFDYDGNQFIHNGGTIDIRTQATTLVDFGSNNGTAHIGNVKINHASCVAKLQNAGSLLGNLEIAQGTLDTDGNALTVAGYTHVGTGSSAADTSTLTLNASTCSFGSGKTDAEALWIKRGGTLVGGSGNWTAGSVVADNHAHCKFTLTTGTITVNGHSADDTRPILLGGTSTGTAAHGGGTIDITYASAYNLHNDSTTSLNNLTLTGNTTATMSGNITMAGNLTVTASTTLDTHSSNNRSLTVTKHIDITGTLTGNASAISTGTMTIRDGATLTTGGTTTVTGEDVANSPSGANWLWRQMEDDGTGFAPTAGTVHFNHASNLNGKHINESKFYNLTLTTGTGHDVAWTPKTADTLTIANDLTIAEGQFKRNVEANTLVVTADVEVHSGGILGDNDETGPNTFGSLLIDSGGTYKATSGTTTITNENSSGFAIQNSGTFTHNNGLVDIDLATPTTTQASNGPYYDFTQSDAATDFYPAEAFEVMNNLFFVGDFDFQNNAHHLTVHGNMTIGDGTTTTRYMPYHTRTCNLTVGGILEVTNGATLTNFSHGTINVGGVRNTGGTM